MVQVEVACTVVASGAYEHAPRTGHLVHGHILQQGAIVRTHVATEAHVHHEWFAHAFRMVPDPGDGIDEAGRIATQGYEEQLRIRRLRFEKLEPLRAAGSVSLEEFERSKADLLIDEERAARIRAQIDNRTLTAPFDGIVSEIRKEMAESVSNAGVHVLTVVQLDTLQVEMHLRPADAARHREGGVVPLLLDDRETVQGRVEFISPVIDAASHTVRIRFTISNPTGTFRSGVRCSPADGNTMAATSSPSSGSDALPPRRMTRTTSETSERPAEDLDPVPPARNRRVLSGL